MIPVYQTKYGDEGNCFQACLASIFEKSIDYFPSVDSEKWVKETNAFLLDKFKLYYMEVSIMKGCIFGIHGHHLMCGKTERSETRQHAVVGFNGVMKHDPLPGGLGLTTPLEDISYGIFIEPFAKG